MNKTIIQHVHFHNLKVKHFVCLNGNFNFFNNNMLKLINSIIITVFKIAPQDMLLKYIFRGFPHVYLGIEVSKFRCLRLFGTKE